MGPARGRGEQPTIATIGHSNRSAAEMIELLEVNGVEQLVDIRSLPGSRRFEQFDRERMVEWLPVAYTHLGELGGRRKAQGIDPQLNAGWENASFRNFADYTVTEAGRQGIARLKELAKPASTVVMCSEAVPWRCHRSLVASVLTAQGWRVEHILGRRSARTHELGAWGPAPRLWPNGDVTYPPPVTRAPPTPR